MFNVPIAVLDIETDTPDAKLFKDMGQLAVKDIEFYAIQYPDGTTVTGNSEMNFRIDLAHLKHVWPDVALVGHNIIRFDAPVLKRIWKVDIIKDFEIFDTLLMSKISEYQRTEHSLESWAVEFRIPKLTLENKAARCINDVNLTNKLFKHLVIRKNALEIPDNPYKVEFRVAEIIARQHSQGVSFDAASAAMDAIHLSVRMKAIKKEVEAEAPLVDIPASKLKMPPKIQFKKDGTPSETLKNYASKHGLEVREHLGKYALAEGSRIVHFPLPITTPFETKAPLDIDSLDEVKKYLIGLGWEPTLWNRKRDATGKYVNTSPKLYDEQKNMCPNLEKMEIPFAKYVSEYYNLRNRQGVLLGWMGNSRLPIDGKLCADADTIGAVTHRFTHKIVANVPRATSAYGKQFRGYFGPSEGKVMVGWDAKQLEARMEAHYTHRYDGGEYAKVLMEGDVHEKNREALTLKSRDDAKTFKYAITYGAQARKLAATFGWILGQAESVFNMFWDTNPSLKQLRDDCAKTVKRGYLRGLDGRPIAVSSEHSALNRLLQSAGAIVMKYAMVIADRDIRKAGLDAAGLIRYHDEEQWEVDPSVADRVGQIGVESIRKAGRYLKLNVPLDGDYKIGVSWVDTH